MKITQDKIITFSTVIVLLALVTLSIFYIQKLHDTRLVANSKNQNKVNIQNTETVSSAQGVDTAPAVSTSQDCNNGTPDDYLHPERFINADGTLKCADGVVIFDHQITPKFIRTIIPYIENETGTTIDFNDIDFYITLPATGETVVYQDIFYWYENGQRTIFNTNKLLWEKWREYIEGNKTYTFNVSMIHRPTNTDISIVFKDHTSMILRFEGLE